MLPGAGPALGPGTVTVTADPTLLAADPSLMAAAASAFQSAAYQINSVAKATSSAASQLTQGWKGKGAESFSGTASDTNSNSQDVAEGLMGAAMALRALSTAIAAAQHLAQQATALAQHTTQASAMLNSNFATSSSAALNALPDNATTAQIAHAVAPTSAQVSRADALDNDAATAMNMMNQANSDAQSAWRAAISAFDACTAQSPSVNLAALNARIKVFTKNMDSEGELALLLAASGAAFGPPGDAGEEDDEIESELLADMAGDPNLPEDVKAEEDMSVGGEKMDPGVAFDLEVTTPYTEIQKAAEQAALDQSPIEPGQTGGGSLRIDPEGSFSESEINAAHYLKDQGYNVELRQPVGTRAGGGTSDMVADGQNWDVYTPKSSNPARIISAIASKGSQVHGGGVIVDLSQTSVTPEQLGDVMARVQGTGSRVGSIIIMPKG